jgi:hypothetical protein
MRSSASLIVRLTRVSALDCNILDGGFGFRQQLVKKTIALTFELINPILGLLQLSRELVCQRHRAVAILVRQVRRLLQIRNKGRRPAGPTWERFKAIGAENLSARNQRRASLNSRNT